MVQGTHMYFFIFKMVGIFKGQSHINSVSTMTIVSQSVSLTGPGNDFFLSIYISDSGLLPGRLSLPSNIPVGKQKHQQY